MAIGQRIKLARKKAKFSMKELADKVGISSAAISKFEHELTAPRQSTLLRLSKALSVGVEYFFREVEVNTLELTYRKHYKFGKKNQEALEAVIRDVLERYLEAKLIFKDTVNSNEQYPSYQANTTEDAELAANKLRQHWNLGTNPIDNLAGILEKKGIAVISLAGPKGFDGVSCWVNSSIPVIAFSNNLPGDRQKFSIAHELGHLFLQTNNINEIETAAHRFAASFIVPYEAAIEELGTKRTNLSFGELLILKKKYGLSIQAWVRRAFDLDIINHSTYTVLCKQISARGWRTNEPGNIPNEEPNHLQLTVYKALAEKLITPSYAATLLAEKTTKTNKIKYLTVPSDELVHLYVADPELTAFTEADLGAIDEEY